MSLLDICYRMNDLPALGVVLVVASTLACAETPTEVHDVPVENRVSDFLLVDQNQTSLRFDPECQNTPDKCQKVSPRDYLQRVSVWYFGHST